MDHAWARLERGEPLAGLRKPKKAGKEIELLLHDLGYGGMATRHRCNPAIPPAALDYYTCRGGGGGGGGGGRCMSVLMIIAIFGQHPYCARQRAIQSGHPLHHIKISGRLHSDWRHNACSISCAAAVLMKETAQFRTIFGSLHIGETLQPKVCAQIATTRQRQALTTQL